MAAETIVFPDVENAARLHLAAAFAARAGFTTVTATAGTKPATLPTEFVHITRTGGTASLVIDRPQITVQTYAKTGARSVAIAQMARAILAAAARDGALGTVTVYALNELSGPYSDPDPNAPTHVRYSATVQLAVRGTAA